MHDLAAALLPYAIALLLLAAAWHDIATRLIPDTVCLLVALAGLLLRAAEGLAPLAVSAGLALALFLLLLPAAMRGALGGGDVKLAAALVLGLSPADAWDFLFLTVMAGGVLGLAYLAAPAWVPPVSRAPAGATLPQRILRIEQWRMRRRGPLPYAVAIAAGGVLVHLPPPGG